MGIYQIVVCSLAASFVGWTNLGQAYKFFKKWIEDEDFNPKSPEFKMYLKQVGGIQLKRLVLAAVVCGLSFLLNLVKPKALGKKMKDLGMKSDFVDDVLSGKYGMSELKNLSDSQLNEFLGGDEIPDGTEGPPSPPNTDGNNVSILPIAALIFYFII